MIEETDENYFCQSSILNLARGGYSFLSPLSLRVLCRLQKLIDKKRSKREEGDRVCIGTAYVRYISLDTTLYIHREARKKVKVVQYQYKYSTRVPDTVLYIVLPIAIDLHLKAPWNEEQIQTSIFHRTSSLVLLVHHGCAIFCIDK